MRSVPDADPALALGADDDEAADTAEEAAADEDDVKVEDGADAE